MRVYHFIFKGLWIGGTVVLIAKNEKEAFEIAKQFIEKDKKLKDKEERV